MPAPNSASISQWTGVPDANTVNQIQQFQQLVNTGYEAIVVIPLEADAWIAPIKKATDAGVIVVTANSDSPRQRARALLRPGSGRRRRRAGRRCSPSSPAARARSR